VAICGGSIKKICESKNTLVWAVVTQEQKEKVPSEHNKLR
jgi:hypothetical protein